LADRYAGPSGERGFWAVFVERARHHFDGGRLSPESFERLVSHFLEPRSWALYPDVLPALDALAARGLPLAIVSNWDSSLPPLLEAHALSARFAAVLVSAAEKLAKPHPGIFLRAAERLGIDPAGILHVGDSLEEDYEAARAAGLSALLVDRAGRHPDVPGRIASLAEIGAFLPAPAARR
ncbi:MAG TPA: HAD-IA family hydrolase, partial [Thermoanaerobaculia bacterium]|nr:HAD-IA family hydrolase [Thermoanaerobaculia bacterium]